MMKVNMTKEMAALGRMTVKDLRAKHVEVFGEATRSGNKDWLRKRILWRIQANAHGDLSERARQGAGSVDQFSPSAFATSRATQAM